jgi:hypothetical protein
MQHRTIGILGSGDVAKALGKGFIAHGARVMLGTGKPQKLAGWKAEAGVQAAVGSMAEAASFGTLLVLAVKGSAAADVLASAGDAALKGKIILDATNPIAEAPPEDGVLRYFTPMNGSLMEDLQRRFPAARFVKCFSCVGNALMVNPDFGGQKPTMFICGNDEGAKTEATEILKTFGWEAADMGTAAGARAIEPLAILWCIPGFRRNSWSHAFKLLTR